MSLYLVALFVALTPGVLVTLPKGGSKYAVIAVHAVLFAAIWHFTNTIVLDMTTEGFQNNDMNSGMNSNARMNNSGNNSGMNTA